MADVAQRKRPGLWIVYALKCQSLLLNDHRFHRYNEKAQVYDEKRTYKVMERSKAKTGNSLHSSSLISRVRRLVDRVPMTLQTTSGVSNRRESRSK